MATLLDRIRSEYTSDYLTDGGAIYPTEFAAYFLAWSAGAVSTAALKTAYSMTTAQAAQLDAIIATRPAAPLLLLNVPAYVQWVGKVAGIVVLAAAYVPAFDTDAKVTTALGI